MTGVQTCALPILKEDYKGPMAGVYGTSPLATMTGLLSLIGSGTTPTTKTTIDPVTLKPIVTSTPGWISGGLDSIKNWLKSNGASDEELVLLGGGDSTPAQDTTATDGV